MSQLSRSALSASFNTNLPDNNSGLITPAVLRTELINTIDSVVFNTGSSAITGSLTISGSGTFTNIGPSQFSGSTNITGSLNTTGSVNITGSLNTTGSVNITGSLNMTGSITISGSGDVITTGDTGSFVTNSQTGSFVTNSQTGSFATTGSNSFSGSLDVSGSMIITGSLTVSGSGTFNNIGPFNQTGESVFTGNITASGHGLFQAGKPITTHTSLPISSSLANAGGYHIVGGNLTASIVLDSTAPIGAEYEFFQSSSTGQFLFESASGTTVISKNGSLRLAQQGSSAVLKKVSSTTFHLMGDLT